MKIIMFYLVLTGFLNLVLAIVLAKEGVLKFQGDEIFVNHSSYSSIALDEGLITDSIDGFEEDYDSENNIYPFCDKEIVI